MQPVFEWLKENAELSWEEMLQIFNCGIGYVLVVPQKQAEETINRIQAFNLPAWQIGSVAIREKDSEGFWGEQVTINF